MIDLNEAKALGLQARRHSAQWDRAAYFVRQFVGENEFFVSFRSLAGQVMGELYFKIMRPLEHQFPELKPLIYEAQDLGTFPPDPQNAAALLIQVSEASAALRLWLQALASNS